MRAFLDQPAIVENENPVRFEDRCQPVRDHQCRAFGHHLFKRPLHRSLVFGIEGGRRLVEKQDRCLLQNRPRDGNPLPLAARQGDAPLARQSRIALRQGSDERVAAARLAACRTASSLASGEP